MNEKKVILYLARKAVEKYIISGEELEINEKQLPEILKKEAGVFVTLKKDGNLRGCMGTFRPVQKNAAYEIISNAMTAAENDPRFPELRKEELTEISISVDILSEPELVNDQEQLDPQKYGILVKGGHQTGLLLPNLEGIDTVEKQLDIAKRKAGLKGSIEVDIYRFTVSRFKENE
ncbi:AmmeMemoRadiSam system protein A [Halanaerobium praevalens]|uniref:AMMECR1 domain protein n=1 Tax=Halanaerobium praevalens (strain ATCC 33744 / DSM 2228 / GSL) TaxID=572479 RepID=E3DPT5_HALPG|nr:AmmeMemoRadiSam system protein A [Halanaerobium praevalens]ADO77777.1 AMMECR1 domain protein [Halanaerobium praevalens DSM 2228]